MQQMLGESRSTWDKEGASEVAVISCSLVWSRILGRILYGNDRDGIGPYPRPDSGDQTEGQRLSKPEVSRGLSLP